MQGTIYRSWEPVHFETVRMVRYIVGTGRAEVSGIVRGVDGTPTETYRETTVRVTTVEDRATGEILYRQVGIGVDALQAAKRLDRPRVR